MAFGPDGYLYIGLGDGGSGGDPQGNGQKLTTLLGKILRIDVDGGDPYAIPPANPFADGRGPARDLGLRAAQSLAILVRPRDRRPVHRRRGPEPVGGDRLPARRERPAGLNFGWNYREGANPYQGEPPAGADLVEPVAQYPHPEGCSVSGGFVYRGAALPEFNGIYLFGDYCTGRIWGLLRQADGSWANKVLFETGTFISSFAQDAAGEVYLLDHRSGAVLKLEGRK